MGDAKRVVGLSHDRAIEEARQDFDYPPPLR
jgi:hypothetical protein